MIREDAATSGAVAPPHDAFRFGRNWQRYISHYLDSDREQIAAESLHSLVGDLRGKTFLDIGCGSGLFSLCAYRAGASRVISLDVDADSVAATSQLRSLAGSPGSWDVMHRSILDGSLKDDIGTVDIVYSWGVLHHTGDMYSAIRNAATFVKPGGHFAIAIYNRVTGRWLSSRRWASIKWAYNHAPRAGQLAMELAFGAYWVMGRLRDRQNPVRLVHEYRRSRGMALWTDLVDWLGGYPYEFARADEIIAFCQSACGLEAISAVRLSAVDTGNNEFLFRRPGN
jgi:2-polyprenyl-6-hydroxyphenyl methylase/3-demethylubiquinone-9 3-methyltransferase